MLQATGYAYYELETIIEKQSVNVHKQLKVTEFIQRLP